MISFLGCLLIFVKVMIYFSVGAPWDYTITPGPYSTAAIAIIPVAIQVAGSFLLPFGLGWLGGRVF